MEDDIPQDRRIIQLLEPIKDVAKNWNVDITALLESYMQEHDIENININVLPSQSAGSYFASSRTQSTRNSLLNFAEAAFLIQGCTQVYSKKVEYLYELTLDLWQSLCKGPTTARPGSDENDEGRREGAEEHRVIRGHKSRRDDMEEADDDGPFAALDELEEGQNINLDETVEKKKRNKRSTKRLKHIPLDLVPLEDYEKSGVPLVTKTGEVIGKKDDYRVNTCFVHNSGALLLDLSNSVLVDAPDDEDPLMGDFPRTQSSACSNSSQIGTAVADNVATNAANISGVPHAVSPPPGEAYPRNTSPQRPESGFQELAATDEHSFDADVDVCDVDNDAKLTRINDRLVEGSTVAANGIGISKEIRPVDKKLEGQENARKLKDHEKRHEAEILLDEFAKSNTKNFYEKCCRKNSRILRVPERLKRKDEKTKCKKRKRDQSGYAYDADKKPNNEDPASLSEFLEKIYKSTSKRNGLIKNPLKVVLYPELDDLFFDEQHRRLLLRKLNRKTLEIERNDDFVRLRSSDQEVPNEQDEAEIDQSQFERNLLAIFEGPDNDDIILTENEPALDMNDVDNYSNIGDLLNDLDFDAGLENQSAITHEKQICLQDNIQPVNVNLETYEDFVKYHVEQYLRRAEEGTFLTDLAQRVHEWEKRIAPVCKMEENRRSFDVDRY
uniref:Condensin-2 complex subunit H2 n=1 Tax=Romanomermis culicivorax TaxID=13658 RepID=A0A915HR83_ROMCU